MKRSERTPRRAVLSAALVLVCAASLAGAEVVERVSVSSFGIEANGGSTNSAISADGRYVAFESSASNLVGDDSNGSTDIFVRDRLTGTTERVSIDSFGNQADGNSFDPAISADGRYVTFRSAATNLVTGDTNASFDVFLHDRQNGTTERISVATGGGQADSNSFRSAISADGRFVAFDSLAENLVVDDLNDSLDIFVRDRQLDITERVSVDSFGNEANWDSTYPDISEDGRIVAFDSRASNLVADDDNLQGDVFVHDRFLGTTRRVSVTSAGIQATDDSQRPEVSADGRFVVFESTAPDLVPGDAGSDSDVFVHDLDTGATERVSIGFDGSEPDGDSLAPSISGDGRIVALQTLATNLFPGDTNNREDIVLVDRVSGAAVRVSASAAGLATNDHARAPSIAADGRSISFYSRASNLVDSDLNGQFDVFVAQPPVLFADGFESDDPG